MASYNRCKRADRDLERADRQAELDAALGGSWPRDIDDQFRWLHPPTNIYLSAAENWRIMREYAAERCRSTIGYLDGVDQRIAAGDPDLRGWEP